MEQSAADPVLNRASDTALDLLVLGPVEASLDGAPLDLGGPKQRAVLALLALRGSRGISVDGVIDGLWGESAPDAASSSVYAYISNLRTILGGGVERERGTYVLTIPFRSDATSFEEAIDRARGQLAADPDGAAETLGDALARWRGLPYADLVEIPGLQDEARRLEELRLLAVEMRFEAGLTAGKGAELVPALQALVVEHPLREQFRGQLMLALYRAGRQAEALRVYAETRELLAEELGVDPSPELQDMELRILQQDEALAVGSGHVTTQRLAFLFTDIEGSTRLWNSHRSLMAGALACHDEIVRETVEDAGGVVFRHTGEGALAVFSGAEHAAIAAERAQRRFMSTDWGPIGDVRVRMAIDLGDVDVRDGDYSGPPLNRCARILAVAHGGQVLLSSTAFHDLSSGDLAGIQIRQLGAHRLRGLGAPERLAQLVFVGLPAEFPELRSDAAAPDLDDRLEIGGLPGFELRERLGVGAWGSVYRAYQPAVGREVAVRMISTDLANRPAFIRRFEAHARAVAQLEHPHIVPLHDFWRGPEGAYLVMQLMRGGSLASALRGEPWPPIKVVELLRQVGAALAYAHGEGAVHGDVRPENVLFDGRGNAYLSDFGLTRGLVEPGVPPVAVGSSVYRSPETRRGDPPDRRSDIFSLATLTSLLLSGCPSPTSGPLPRAASGVGGSGAVDAVVLRGTAADPGDRFEDVEGFVAALERALGVGDIPDRPPVRTTLRNPYKGLRPFSETDAGDFHGRSGLVETLVEAVSAHRFVAVVGPSGSGKSSVVQAGLIPRLRAAAIPRSDEWFVAVMEPGPSPIAALGDALRPLASTPLGDIEGRLLMRGATIPDLARDILPAESGELVLVVDQFEELFTLTADAVERERFVDLLAGAVDGGSRMRVIVTLRADFYARPLEYPALASLITAGMVTVVPPTVDELIDAIRLPAVTAGFVFEPGLPMRIAGDVLGQPGSLPLLQYALTEMVERRSSDLLTGADYEAIGTVRGAVARRAESVFSSLDGGEQRTAQGIFLRLVSVDREAGEARRRARLGELEGLGHHPRAVRRVLDVFGSTRLLLFDRDPVTRAPTVEVAHESLLREWDRLRGWIDDERTELVLARRFRAAMAEWEDSDRNDDYLLTGDRLAPFRDWAASAPLARDERVFIDRSIEADESIRTAIRRRRRLAFAAVSIAATVATILAVLAFVQGRRADDEAARAAVLAEQESEARLEAEGQASLAEQQRRLALQQTERAENSAADARQAEALARVRELAASAIGVGDEDPQLAMLLALEAIDVAPSPTDLPPQVVSALRTAIHGDRLERTIDFGSEDPAFVRSVAGDSLLVVSSETDRVLSTETWNEVPFVPLEDGVRVEAVSPDAATVLLSRAGSGDAGLTELRAVDVVSGSVLHEFTVDCVLGPSDWSPDGDLAVLITGCGDPNQSADLYDVVTWTRVARYELTYPTTVRFARGEGVHRLLVADLEGDPGIRVIDTTTNEVIATFASSSGALSPDGSTVVAYDVFEVTLVDVDSGQVLDRLTGFDSLPRFGSAVFSPDGELVTLATEGAHAPVWDVESGELVAEVPAGAHESVAFGATGDTLVTGAFDGTVSVWDLSPAATGEINSADVGWVQSYAAQAGSQLGVVWTFDLDRYEPFGFTFDPGSGIIGERLPEATAFWPAVAGDVIVYWALGDQPLGPVRAWNPVSGDIADLSGCWRQSPVEPCPDGVAPADFSGLWSSVDGSEAGLLRADGSFETWGAGGVPTGRVTLALGDHGGFLMGFNEDWVLVRTADLGGYEVFDRDSGGLMSSFEVPSGSWVRFDRDGRIGIAWGFDSTLSILHPDDDWSFEVLTVDLGDGTPRGVALSPTGDRVAVGAQDGFLRIFEVESGKLLDEIEIGEVTGAYWIDDTHVGVGTRDGLWTSLTLDPKELVALAQAAVQRTFTANECALYRLDSCAP